MLHTKATNYGGKVWGLNMTTMHIKQLEVLKEKRKALQTQEDEIRHKLTLEISNFLIDTQAFDHIEFDIIMGGILDVIEKAKQGDKSTEAWKLSGEKFRQGKKKRNSQKNTSAPKKIKKGKDHDK